MQALATVRAGEWLSMLNIVSCIHNFTVNFFFIIVKSDFVTELLGNFFFLTWQWFSLKVAIWLLGIFFNFEPCSHRKLTNLASISVH